MDLGRLRSSMLMPSSFGAALVGSSAGAADALLFLAGIVGYERNHNCAERDRGGERGDRAKN